MPSPRRRFLRTLALGSLGLAIACQATPSTQTSRLGQPVRIGSKDFTEQFILGELYAQLLERKGIPVERKLNLGGTPVAHAGLVNGEIDLYPEYTGTGLLTVLKLPSQRDRKTVFTTVAQAYQRQFNLVWLDPAPLNNSQALAVTATTAQTLKLKTISDLTQHAATLTLIGPPEFQVREDGLPGLQAAYGQFQFKAYKAVDPGLRYQGLTAGQADVAVVFGTDGEITALKLVVLEDDRQFFPPYQVAPVVRPAILAAYPSLAPTLNALSAKLTTATMQRLNYEVSGKGQEPSAVAKAFLQEVGL